MIQIATTRFNADTLRDNRIYANKIKRRSDSQNIACVYGVSRKITDKCKLNSLVFVIEMNNTTNCVEGIGVIRNVIRYENEKIYDNNYYNIVIYNGTKWISRDDIETHDPILVATLDKILFTGKSHVKRLIGISLITKKLLDNWDLNEFDLRQQITNVFRASITNKS